MKEKINNWFISVFTARKYPLLSWSFEVLGKYRLDVTMLAAVQLKDKTQI